MGEVSNDAAGETSILGGEGFMWYQWLTVLFGLWVLVSPFILTQASTLKWSNVIFGILVAVFAYMTTTKKT